MIAQKIKQYFLNRSFDEQLEKHLHQKAIQLVKTKNQITAFLPHQVDLRLGSSSDFSVFLQVFFEEQYAPVISLCNLNQIKVTHILDLGANVGFTSIYFARHFSDAQIFAVEPDLNNFKYLKKNSQNLRQIYCKKAAVWAYRTKLNPTFEEQSDWGKTFIEDEALKPESIDALSITDLLSEFDITALDILKIDIEGAEKQIFENNLAFLKIVKVIAIEIHEHVIKKDIIHHHLLQNNFIIMEQGELTIGFNRNFAPNK
jgi:FkbM family methyltransferase